MIDEFGGNVVIVTLQPIIAEVIGQLPDEFGLERREFQRLGEDDWHLIYPHPAAGKNACRTF